jgi:integrase
MSGPRKLPLNVVRQRTQHGKIVFYYRIGQGKRTRLPDISAPEFMDVYMACVRGAPIPKRGMEDARTFAWLLARYKESTAWTQLAPATRRARDNIFKNILKKNAQTPFKAFTKKAMDNGMEDRAHTPAQANCFLKAMHGVFKWAVSKEHMEINPAIGVVNLKLKSDGFPVWTVEDVAAFCAKWPIGTKQRLAFELALHTGLRRSDLCRIGKQHLKGNTLTVRTSKTGTTVTLALPQRVLDIIGQTPTGELHFLVTDFKRPFVVAGFGNWFADASRKADIKKNTHGLRKLAATLAANGGATAHQLMSQFGWVNSKQAEVYTKGADRVHLGKASSAIVSEQLANILIPHQLPDEGSDEEDTVKTST